MTFRAHAAVRQDLRNGFFRGRTLFEFVCAAERLDVVERMVKADVLQRIRNALNQIFLLDDGHGLNVWGRAYRKLYRDVGYFHWRLEWRSIVLLQLYS